MSTSATDSIIDAIEARIRRDRDPAPCDAYQATSKDIELCSYCGWDEVAHVGEKNRREALA